MSELVARLRNAAEHIEALERELDELHGARVAREVRLMELEAALRAIAASPMHDTAWGHVMQIREFASRAVESKHG